MSAAYLRDICYVVALVAWCGLMWSQVRVLKQLRAAGYNIWTFNERARWNAWKGTNFVLFLSCGAVFAAAILAAIAIH
jgi:hypothetical protein